MLLAQLPQLWSVRPIQAPLFTLASTLAMGLVLVTLTSTHQLFPTAWGWKVAVNVPPVPQTTGWEIAVSPVVLVARNTTVLPLATKKDLAQVPQLVLLKAVHVPPFTCALTPARG